MKREREPHQQSLEPWLSVEILLTKGLKKIFFPVLWLSCASRKRGARQKLSPRYGDLNFNYTIHFGQGSNAQRAESRCGVEQSERTDERKKNCERNNF